MTVTPGDLTPARAVLHRVAAHVLGRRRHEVTGRFGLRASPGGFATPAFGDGPEVLRVAGGVLVRETAAGAAYVGITGSTLRELAVFAGADISTEFSPGSDAPEVGDVDQPLALDASSADVLARWLALGWRVLDRALAALPGEAGPAVVQLWPEHFDAGTNVGVGNGQRCNLGASPGDSYSDEPYLYVGPWGAERPGDPLFWNAPFGAILRRREVEAAPEPFETGVQFLLAGLQHLTDAR